MTLREIAGELHTVVENLLCSFQGDTSIPQPDDFDDDLEALYAIAEALDAPGLKRAHKAFGEARDGLAEAISALRSACDDCEELAVRLDKFAKPDEPASSDDTPDWLRNALEEEAT